MAEALHIDRDRLHPVAARPRGARSASGRWSSGARTGEPVAYITGRRAFWNIELHVGPGVLVPRPGFSEVLIASAIEHFEGTGGPERILDLGTGPGTLLLAALDIWPEATGLGVDVSRQRSVLCLGQCPAARASRARVKLKLQGNWADGLVETFDLILCNPPYVAEGAELGPGVREYEPDEALFAGERGSTPIARSRPQLPRLLEPRRTRRGRDRPRPGRRGDRSCSPATGSRRGSRRTSPAAPRAVLLNLGLNENRLASGVGATTSVVRAGPAPR